MDPHPPYRPPAFWRFRYDHESAPAARAGRIPIFAREPGITDPRWYVARYDEEIAYVDAELGRLLAGYAERRPIDEALVVFTADHGESLVERGIPFTHAIHVFEEVIRVPLLMRGPGVAPGRDDELVSGVDVLPTLLAFAGVPPPASLPGVDLRSALPGSRRTVFSESVPYAGRSRWRAAVRGEHKWVVKLRESPAPVQERQLFDLAADPREYEPEEWSGEAEPARRLLELVETDPDPGGYPQSPRRGGLTERTTDLLRALGYVGDEPEP